MRRDAIHVSRKGRSSGPEASRAGIVVRWAVERSYRWRHAPKALRARFRHHPPRAVANACPTHVGDGRLMTAVVTNARVYYPPRAATGASGTRHSPLPPWGSATPFVGRRFMHSSGATCRGNAPGRRRPRKRAIQYSETPMLGPRSCGVLDTPLSRSMTASYEAWLFEN
jgi:hypothetical protein